MFRKDWKLEQLATIDVFAHLSKRTLREVGGLCSVIQLPAGKVLWAQGETAREAFVVLDGELQLTWNGTPLETVQPGAVVGGVGLADADQRLTTATTATTVEALVMSRGEYRRLLSLCPEVEGRVQAGHRARFAAVRKTAVA